MTREAAPVDTEKAAYLRLLRANAGHQLAYIDLDAFADGIVAHRAGVAFHQNPHGPDALTAARLSWSMGWNERALQQ